MYPIFVLGIVSEIVPILFASSRRRSLDSPLRLFAGYLILSFFVDIGSQILAYFKINNLWLIRLYTPLEFGLLLGTLIQWVENPRIRRLPPKTIGLISAAILFLLLTLEAPTAFNNITKGVSAVVLVAISGLIIVEKGTSNARSLFELPSAWISIGLLMYFSVAVVVYGISNVLLTLPRELALLPWEVKAIAHIGANVLFAGGYKCLPAR